MSARIYKNSDDRIRRSKNNLGSSDFLKDHRPESVVQNQLQELSNQSVQVQQATQMQTLADNHSKTLIQRMPMPEEEEPIQGKLTPVIQQAESSSEANQNKTGLPDNLKSGIENMSGFSMNDVNVKYNSSKPAQLNAHAFAQGSNIHIAPGQEKHLPHEAWHVVQQKQGRVKPTMKMKGVDINDSPKLENEADKMGSYSKKVGSNSSQKKGDNAPVQKKTAQPAFQLLKYDEPPQSWGDVDEVKRSGEGVAGVFFVRKGGDKVVVKPESNFDRISFANKFLGEGLGFETPPVTSYKKGSAGGTALSSLLIEHKNVGRTETEVEDQIKSNAGFMVMGLVEGQSIQTMDEAAASEFIQNASALQNVGRLMVGDAFIGNDDRLVGGRINLGNFFYRAATLLNPGNISTIDNEARIKGGEINKRGNLTGDLDGKIFKLNMLINNPSPYINQFLAAFKNSHREHANTLAVTNDDFVTKKIKAGVAKGLTDMASVFTTNTELIASLSAYSDKANLDYDSAKGLSKYVKARVTDSKDADTAKASLTNYVKYRAKRNKTYNGFKWVTKLFSNTGF